MHVKWYDRNEQNVRFVVDLIEIPKLLFSFRVCGGRFDSNEETKHIPSEERVKKETTRQHKSKLNRIWMVNGVISVCIMFDGSNESIWTLR